MTVGDLMRATLKITHLLLAELVSIAVQVKAFSFILNLGSTNVAERCT